MKHFIRVLYSIIVNLPRITNSKSDPKSSVSTTFKKSKDDSYVLLNKIRCGNPYEEGVLIGMAIIATSIIQLQIGNRGDGGGGTETYVGGSMSVDVINSSWLQVILAGVTWYLIGIVGVELIAALLIKSHDIEND